MRAVWALAFLLVAPLVSGCLSLSEPETLRGPADVPLDIAGIHVPEGADLVRDPVGAILRFANVSFPFEETITLPAGAEIVRLEAGLLEQTTLRVSTYMKNEETGRRRCNADVVTTAWNARYEGTHACTGMTAIDPPGTNWTIQVSGPINAATGVSPANLVEVVYEDAPVDGHVALLDLSLLSMPIHEVKATQGFYVPSFDGTALWVEVTLPEGEGPWPTVIAASPYNGQANRLSHGGPPAMWEYWTHDWAKRGYAAVNVDVRGFGLSGGCVEIWSENEQRDQAFIVDWVAEQAWSNDRVGFYGQSYVGTTPTAAAVYAPEALKAIIAVAPVINSYEDWHIGGVPNGENTGSPVAYQVLTDVPSQNPDHVFATGPLGLIENEVKGVCDPTIIAEANDPRGIYDDFYAERDFKPRAKDVKAAVLYTEGFEDSNVKSAMIPGWFNEIDAPKLGLFGHWVHQHPTRADEEILFLGWMDEHVKGLPLGFSKLPQVIVSTNDGTQRGTDAWPTPGLDTLQLWPDWSNGALSSDEGAARGATLTIAPPETGAASTLTVAFDVTEPFAMSGTPHLNMRGTLTTKGNAFLYGAIYDVHDGRRDLITYGAYNLAHDATHTTWTAVTGPSDVLMPFLPTEYVFRPGHQLVVELSGAADPTTVPGLGTVLGQFEIGQHPDGVGALILDTVPLEAYEPIPRSGRE